jgi:hypothetical protein
MGEPNMTQFDAVAWFQLLTLGGLAGAMGQAIRVIVGIKKLNDQASDTNTSLAAMIVPTQLVVSLLIGFIAGALASSQLISDLAHISSQQIFALSAAGYAGADFIEGFMTRITPNLPAPAPTAAPTPTPAAAAPIAALPASADGAVG